MFSHKLKILFFSIVFAVLFLTPSVSHAGQYDAIGGTATCSAGQVLGRLISSSVGQAVGSITNRVGGKVVDTVKSLTKVPVFDSAVKEETAAGAQNTAALRGKTVGGGNPGGVGGIISGIVGAFTDVSWDSIMYCVVNEIMTYITQSTIQWIKSGFNGNPVFVENIGAMFQKIADREASNFTREISNGAKNAERIAVNGIRNSAFQVAEPFRRGAMETIAGASRKIAGATPTMSPQLTQNYNAFVSGNWNTPGGGAMGLMQVSRSNQYVANMNTKIEYDRRVAEAQSIQQSQITNGTQSFYRCKDGKKDPSGYCSPVDRIVTAPAQFINDETSSVNGMKYLRISFAKDFDSVVTALVNQLVKIAINKVYEEVQN